MSGGSLDYVYSKVEDAAAKIRSNARHSTHFAFADHLMKVAKALHDVEWTFSGDYGVGDDVEAINAVVTPQQHLDTALTIARESLSMLEGAIARASTNGS